MRRFRILVPLVVLSACKASDSTGPTAAAHVQIVPAQQTLTSVGATQQFTAQVLDDGGTPISGASLAWSSSNPAILKVDATGLATALAEGDAQVLAQSSGVTGNADVSVDVPDCVAPQTVQLAVGGVLVTDPPSGTRCALTLPSSANGRYRVAIVRVAQTLDATTADATFSSTPLGAVTGAPVAELQTPYSGPMLGVREMETLRQASVIADATERVDARLRAGEDELLRRLGPLHPHAVELPSTGPRAVSPARRTFLARLPSDIQCAPTPTAVPAVLLAQSADIAIYQDSAQAANTPVDTTYARQMINFYDSYGRSTDESYFGSIPDHDGNGQVVVFATPQVSGNIAAFVWGGDQLTKADCPASNEMELVYFNSGLINQIANNQFQALETLAHEVKHVISFHERITGRVFTTQPTWVEEGTAEIAGEIASRKAWALEKNGTPINAVVNAGSFTKSGSSVAFTPGNFGIYLRLLRAEQYLSAQPNSLTFATSAAYSIYGSGWHFHRFVGDAYGNALAGQEAALFLQQNRASTPVGIPGLKVVTGRGFADLMTDFAAAIMLSGSAAPANGRGFTTYDFPSATSVIKPGYPYPVKTCSFLACTWTGSIGNAGIAILEITSNGSGVGTQFTVQVAAPARVVVTRLR